MKKNEEPKINPQEHTVTEKKDERSMKISLMKRRSLENTFAPGVDLQSHAQEEALWITCSQSHAQEEEDSIAFFAGAARPRFLNFSREREG